MPAQVSDIHEFAVLVGLSGKTKETDGLEKKFRLFNVFSNEYGHGKIKITKNEFSKKEELFNP